MMDRRNFIKQSACLASGIALFNGAAAVRNLFAKSNSLENFSLNLITNRPEQAILKVEALLDHADLRHEGVKFTEYAVAGNHVGDIVLIKNHNLINFRTAHDAFSKQVLEISKELGLPRILENPTFLRFGTANSGQMPKYVNVFRGNVLIQRLDIDAEQEAFEVRSSKGPVIIAIKNRSVAMVASSCRHKTCMKMGNIHTPGQNIVCIPNRLRISIEGQSRRGVDSVSY